MRAPVLAPTAAALEEKKFSHKNDTKKPNKFNYEINRQVKDLYTHAVLLNAQKDFNEWMNEVPAKYLSHLPVVFFFVFFVFFFVVAFFFL